MLLALKMVVLVMKLILQVALFVAFFKFYGLPALALARLGKKSTIVIKTRRNTSGIEAASITISARSRDTGMGWKEKQITNAHSNNTIKYQCKNYPDVEKCLDSQFYKWTDFIKGTLLGYEKSCL